MAQDYISLLVHSVFPASIFMEPKALPAGYSFVDKGWQYNGNNAQASSLGPLENNQMSLGSRVRFRLLQYERQKD